MITIPPDDSKSTVLQNLLADSVKQTRLKNDYDSLICHYGAMCNKYDKYASLNENDELDKVQYFKLI